MLCRSVLAVSVSLTLASAAMADPGKVPIPTSPGITEAEQLAQARSRDFGLTHYNIMQIPASAFHPEYSAGKFSWVLDGYVGPDSGLSPTYGWLWAPLLLPTGAKLIYLDLYANDTNASANIRAYVQKIYGESLSPMAPSYAPIASVSSSGSAGYGYFPSSAVSHTVNNNSRYDANGGKYFIEIAFESDTGLSTSGVDVWWQRQVAPAPATPTFSDVPTTHIFYQYVEALKASGITTGKTLTTFAPDEAVTRGQIAAFLSRALGLGYYDDGGLILLGP